MLWATVHMTTTSLKVHAYDHPLLQDPSQEEYSYPPKNLIVEEIGLHLVWWTYEDVL